MAYRTDTITIYPNLYTLVTNKIAMIQFRENAKVILNNGDQPQPSDNGFNFSGSQIHVNGSPDITVWAKAAGTSTPTNVFVSYDDGV